MQHPVGIKSKMAFNQSYRFENRPSSWIFEYLLAIFFPQVRDFGLKPTNVKRDSGCFRVQELHISTLKTAFFMCAPTNFIFVPRRMPPQ